MDDAAIALAVEKSSIPSAEELGDEQMDEATARALIVDHVNTYHRRELQLYLRHVAGNPDRASVVAGARPELLNITEAGLTIQRDTSNAKSAAEPPAFVPFDPPLTSLADSRTRLVAMALEARAALGLGAFDVYEFRPPRGADWIPFFGVLLYYACAVARPWVVPGTTAWSVLDMIFAPLGGAKGWHWIVGAIFWPVVGIHVIEVIWLIKTRLRRFNIGSGMLVWWLWCLSCFIEGLGAISRFDDMVEDIRALLEGRVRDKKKYV